MAKHILLLHSSNDLNVLKDLERSARTSVYKDEWKLWIDQPAFATTATLGAHAPVDKQIADAIRHAFAIVYLVGRTGPGPYQKLVEAGLIRTVLEERMNADDPLRFVPVLLREGNLSDIPEWANQYTVVNRTRELRNWKLWEPIEQRLSQPPEAFNCDFVYQPKVDIEESWTSDIIQNLGFPHSLTIFIGPYAAPDAVEIGPAAMTEQLLYPLKIPADKLGPMLPWPSEAAEWLHVADSRAPVLEFFTGGAITRLGFNPADLPVRLGDLAARWCERRSRPAGRKDWSGLLLLTTRVDLAVEAALLSASVKFTRFLPTAANTDLSTRKRMLERWMPGKKFDADPFVDQSPWVESLAVPNESQISLDDAQCVILVKLCGSIDVTETLVVTASDLFQQAAKLAALPQQMRECIYSSPQLLIGRGFASPLAQLVRLVVLGQRKPHLPRVLVIPESPLAYDDQTKPLDGLCDLEMRLMDTKENAFRLAMELTQLRRAVPERFLDRLTAAL